MILCLCINLFTPSGFVVKSVCSAQPAQHYCLPIVQYQMVAYLMTEVLGCEELNIYNSPGLTINMAEISLIHDLLFLPISTIESLSWLVHA